MRLDLVFRTLADILVSDVFTMVIDKHACFFFLHPALAQTRDYSRSVYTCTHVLNYGTSIHTRKVNEVKTSNTIRDRREWGGYIGALKSAEKALISPSNK